jgi:hypothetical protein
MSASVTVCLAVVTEVLPEYVRLRFGLCPAHLVLRGDGGQRRGGALDRGALHVVVHAPDTAHFLAAPGAPRSAVHQQGQGRAVAGRFGRAVPVEHENAAVHGRGLEHEVPLLAGIVAGERAAQGATSLAG